MVQGLSSQGSVGRCVERIRVIGHVVLLGWVPCVPWCGRLIRTWTRYFEPGQYRPRTEQAARVRDSRLMCGTGRPRVGGGGPTPGSPHRARTRYAESGPSCPHVDPLFRAWAIPPAYGTGGPRVGWPVDVRNRQTACRRRWPYTRLAASRANPLCGAGAFSSARGPAIPSLGNPAHMRNRRPTCGTGGPRAGQVVRVRDAREPESLSHAANP